MDRGKEGEREKEREEELPWVISYNHTTYIILISDIMIVCVFYRLQETSQGSDDVPIAEGTSSSGTGIDPGPSTPIFGITYDEGRQMVIQSRMNPHDRYRVEQTVSNGVADDGRR